MPLDAITQLPGPIPFVPPTAPFTSEQRAWLNGYFVGLLSNARQEMSAELKAEPSAAKPPVLILYGSQTGSAESLAKKLARESAGAGFVPQVRELNAVAPAELAKESRLLVVTSTWGDGDPPDNAAEFWKALCAPDTPTLASLEYSVLALGDRNYPDFCGAGRKFDERLAQLGARRVHPRVDCDLDYEAAASQWMKSALAALKNGIGSNGEAKSEEVASPSILSKATSKWSRQNPFPARLLANRKLNAPASAKDTRHIEISLEGSGLQYEPGDALGIFPRNCPELVREVIAAGGWNADQLVPLPEGGEAPLAEALMTRYDLRKISGQLAAASHLNGHPCEEVIDLLLAHREFRPPAAEFVRLLGKLQPRLYSISSSLKAFPGQVHLTVGVVRYENLSRQRKGVCSTFLAERVQPEDGLPVFIHSSAFRLPQDTATPIIMVGPGTGIAPFRAFLLERQALGATGRSWLFFGDQQQACDFLYQQELERFLNSGVLTRLDTAFSRDQERKVYVQHRLLEASAQIFAWLEEGAHFYVCGDAKRMARDVDEALHEILRRAGKSAEQAAEYVAALKKEKRYQRDVY